MNLPPLPAPTELRIGYQSPTGYTVCGYTDEQMQAYGQQCRAAALEEVTALSKEHYTLTTREVISQIRSMK